MEEFARVTDQGGRLEIVDIGKPDGAFRRNLIELYVVALMPMIARFFIGGRTMGNPFRMIVPTFHRLATNRAVAGLAEKEFGSARLHEFLLGGLVMVEATRTTQTPREVASSCFYNYDTVHRFLDISPVSDRPDVDSKHDYDHPFCLNP